MQQQPKPWQKVEFFLYELNGILKNSKLQHWGYEGIMTIDSAFSINKDGILSLTVRYATDSSFIRTRMEAPVYKIESVSYDLYLILEYQGGEVTVYESEPGKNELVPLNKSNLFDIGVPQKDGYIQQEKLQKLLEKVLKYCKN